VVISGPDGIGKTQLALEYAHACAADRPVAWINFSSSDNVPIRVSAEGAAAASELRPDYKELSLDDQLHSVLRVWQADEDRLLVFDDCPDEDLLREWVPAAGQARILVTSRLETWDGGTRPLAP
jgi:ATP/maltotriose-dependent transcriptional regulator MalT